MRYAFGRVVVLGLLITRLVACFKLVCHLAGHENQYEISVTRVLIKRNKLLNNVHFGCSCNLNECFSSLVLQPIAGFHLTSWRPCWCSLNKRNLIISFVWNTKMAAMSLLFCVSWDCVKTKNVFLTLWIVCKRSVTFYLT